MFENLLLVEKLWKKFLSFPHSIYGGYASEFLMACAWNPLNRMDFRVTEMWERLYQVFFCSAEIFPELSEFSTVFPKQVLQVIIVNKIL